MRGLHFIKGTQYRLVGILHLVNPSFVQGEECCRRIRQKANREGNNNVCTN